MHKVPDAELQKGIVSVSFDDGWESVSTNAATLLDKYHIRSTFYIISDVAAHNVNGYMSFDDIKRLKRAGHEIGSHSLTHCNQTTLSSADIQENALYSKQLLEQQNLGPIVSFAYPMGQYNETTQNIYKKYYPLIRSSDFGYNDRYFDATNIHSIAIVNTTTDKDLQAWLMYARQHRLWLVLVYHRVDESGEYNVTSDQLERQLNIIAHSNLTILPIGAAAETARR